MITEDFNYENALNYTNENWTKGLPFLWRMHQERVLTETLNILCKKALENGITIRYNEKEYNFKCFSDELSLAKVMFKKTWKRCKWRV